MSHVQFSKMLAGLAVDAASAARNEIEMVEIDEDGAPSSADVLRVTNRLRERILWIERRLAGVEQKEGSE